MSQTKTSATRAIFWNAYVISKYVFILLKGQFLLVRAVGRTEKGGYTMGGILSLSVDEDDVLSHRRFNLHCDAIDVLKLS